VFIFNIIQYTPVTIDGYKYPAWADGLGWLLALFPLFWISGSMIWKISTVKNDSMSLLQVRKQYVIDMYPLHRCTYTYEHCTLYMIPASYHLLFTHKHIFHFSLYINIKKHFPLPN